MYQYHNLINDILTRGVDVFNSRTGAVCKTLVGCQLSFPATGRDFPALTTRKLPFKSIVGELLGFFRGYTSAEDFRALGCKFWDANANETKAWLSNPYRRGTDDLGRIYGAQWTGWSDKRVVFDSQVEEYLQQGYLYRGHIEYEHAPNRYDPTGVTYDGLVLMERYINQLENAVRTILTNPSDRRIIVSGWNVAEFDRMALPPCHIQYNFIPMQETGEMSVVMTIRSMDVFLGTPANIASTAVFLAVMCRLTGYTPGEVIIQGANAHLYENSFGAARELLTREHFPAPRLVLSEAIREIKDLKDITGCFTRIQPEDIYLEDYRSHGVLTVPMVA